MCGTGHGEAWPIGTPGHSVSWATDPGHATAFREHAWGAVGSWWASASSHEPWLLGEAQERLQLPRNVPSKKFGLVQASTLWWQWQRSIYAYLCARWKKQEISAALANTVTHGHTTIIDFEPFSAIDHSQAYQRFVNHTAWLLWISLTSWATISLTMVTL